MREEASKIFKNYKQVKLHIYEAYKKDNSFYKLAWNYIG
jgi:hypothetical protein